MGSACTTARNLPPAIMATDLDSTTQADLLSATLFISVSPDSATSTADDSVGPACSHDSAETASLLTSTSSDFDWSMKPTASGFVDRLRLATRCERPVITVDPPTPIVIATSEPTPAYHTKAGKLSALYRPKPRRMRFSKRVPVQPWPQVEEVLSPLPPKSRQHAKGAPSPRRPWHQSFDWVTVDPNRPVEVKNSQKVQRVPSRSTVPH
eukprot:NODE_2368_length_1437_cov_208.153729_g2251_i0.p1 GENE.NODE_2368_length_1437_cov_208.153729_g2251_i0~~NODE_2368_length_1437_cov_208.153729_g2251_i0.p1  ORF type:complete len:228 (+),score=28.47 NODE_2368_length_1437_cov_208.153729_g2251_i0:59-685(+)